MHMWENSHSEIYISSRRPEGRVFMFWPREEIQKLSLESTEVYMTDLLDRYVHRSGELDEVCFGDFAANYKYFK